MRLFISKLFSMQDSQLRPFSHRNSVAVDDITQQKPDNVNPPKSKEKILQAKITSADFQPMRRIYMQRFNHCFHLNRQNSEWVKVEIEPSPTFPRQKDDCLVLAIHLFTYLVAIPEKSQLLNSKIKL